MVKTKEELCLDQFRDGTFTVDDLGRVWRHKRYRSNGNVQQFDKPKRADVADKLGYCRFGFRANGKGMITYAHRMMWVVNNGPIPVGLEINHKDGDKANNRLENLELVTRSENIRHCISITNTFVKRVGTDNPIARLTPEGVRAIRAARSSGKTYGQIGREFGVSSTTVRAIVMREAWKHVS